MEDQRSTTRRSEDVQEWRTAQLEAQYTKLQSGVDQINGKLSIIGAMQTAHGELVRQVEACRSDHLTGDRELWKKINAQDEKINEQATKLSTVEQAGKSSDRVSWLILIAIVGQGALFWLKG